MAGDPSPLLARREPDPAPGWPSGWSNRANIGHSLLRPNMLLTSGKTFQEPPMINRHINHFRPKVLVTFLVALGLLFAGVRVPDISRPHRPKPSQRVVLENHQKSFSDNLKHCSDVVAVVSKPPRLSDSISYIATTPVVSPLYAAPSFFPNSGRSPPTARS